MDSGEQVVNVVFDRIIYRIEEKGVRNGDGSYRTENIMITG